MFFKNKNYKAQAYMYLGFSFINGVIITWIKGPNSFSPIFILLAGFMMLSICVLIASGIGYFIKPIPKNQTAFNEVDQLDILDAGEIASKSLALKRINAYMFRIKLSFILSLLFLILFTY